MRSLAAATPNPSTLTPLSLSLPTQVAMDLSNLGIVYRVQGRRDEAIALFQRAYTIMTEALGPEDPKTLTVARNLSATQVIEVDVVEKPKAVPAALAQRLSTPRGRTKTSEEVAETLEAAKEKREAVLNAKVERAAELRTPRGGQSSNMPSGGDEDNEQASGQTDDGAVDVSDDITTTGAPTGTPNIVMPPSTAPGAPPSMPKLKLNLKPPVSNDSGGAATPRSTYSKASSDARQAVENSKSGKGSARSMLHKHVAEFDFGSGNSPG